MYVLFCRFLNRLCIKVCTVHTRADDRYAHVSVTVECAHRHIKCIHANTRRFSLFKT